MGKDKLIPILALIIIGIGVSSSVYVYATHIEKSTITINDHEYTPDEIFYLANSKTVNTSEGIKTGVSLDDLLLKIGIKCPSCNEYTIKAVDGYQKTVTWEMIRDGILTKEPRVYFPSYPRSFWVSDVIEIEIKEV